MNAFASIKRQTYCHMLMDELSAETLIIPDTLSEKFQANPELNPLEGFPSTRFYASAVIKLGSYRIGSFCILDSHPRYDFCDNDCQMLLEMAGIVSDMLLELRKASMIESR